MAADPAGGEVPARFVEAGKAAYAWRGIDAELAGSPDHEPDQEPGRAGAAGRAQWPGHADHSEGPDVSAADAEPFEVSIAPWLAVSNAQAAADFYRAAFGAVEVYRLDGDDGSLAVAQLSIGGAVFWVQDDGASAERPGAGSVRMILSVEDPDMVFDQAVAAGAVVVTPVSEAYGWRTGRVTDPFGHDWETSRQLPTS